MKTNRALARVVPPQFVLESLDRRAAPGVEGAVAGRRAKEHKHLPVETECRELVADALFSPWRRRQNDLSQLLERSSIAAAQRRQVVVDGFGLRFGSHGSLPLATGRTARSIIRRRPLLLLLGGARGHPKRAKVVDTNGSQSGWRLGRRSRQPDCIAIRRGVNRQCP